jgi:response regulator RpfG family c-di-GMP phosphodiesterase
MSASAENKARLSPESAGIAPAAPGPWKIMIVDDDKSIHAVTKLALSAYSFHGRPVAWLDAYSGEEAVQLVRQHSDVALVLMDVVMETDSAGLDAAQRIRDELRNPFVRIAVRTGQAGVVHEEEVVRRYCIDDYREKTELTATRLFTLVHTSLAHYDQLRTLEDARAQTELVVALSEAIEARSPDTGNHLRRVAAYSRLLAQLAGLDQASTHLLYLAAPLHDAGKIAIPDAVLHKPGAHDEAEAEVMRSHAEIGRRIFGNHESPVLQAAAIVAGQHHERWDGQGYPNGLAGEHIHIYGRIIAIVDVFDALTHPRCYKEAWPLKSALEYLAQESGRRFDPALIELFMQNLDQFIEIYNRLRDPDGTVH